MMEAKVPRGLGQARIAFVSGKTMDCEEPFTMVMSLVVGALQPNGSAQEEAS